MNNIYINKNDLPVFIYLFSTNYCFKFKFNRGNNYIETVITFKFKGCGINVVASLKLQNFMIVILLSCFFL